MRALTLALAMLVALPTVATVPAFADDDPREEMMEKKKEMMEKKAEMKKKMMKAKMKAAKERADALD